MVVAVAGRVEHGEVVRRVRKAFAEVLHDAEARAVRRSDKPPLRRPSQSVAVVNRRNEQAHLVYGVPGLDRFDERRFALGVLETAIGGGMSSRLFQEIRERHALAYSVYAFSSMFAGDGVLGAYAATAPTNAKQVVELIQACFADVAANGLSDDEIVRAKGQMCGNLVLGMEDSGSRMSRLGRSELIFGDHHDIAWLVEQIDAVTASDVAELAADLLMRPASLSVVGPFRRGSFDAVMS